MKTEELDLLDILLDEDNKDPIILMGEDGRKLTFKQVAVIPCEVKKEKRLYCVLKPLDKIKSLEDDEAIVFLIDTDDEANSILRLEEDEIIAVKVFEKYYDLLEQAIEEEGNDIENLDELRKSLQERKKTK